MTQENSSAFPAQAPAESASRESSAAALPKAYDPSTIEQRWAEYWVRERLFDVPTPAPRGEHGTAATDPAPKRADQDASKPFTILLPPPNVTGRLHMGHMLNQTEMDILTRWHRMQGQTSLWVPGTDHAGIATQMMVERQLAAEGVTRQDLGREEFTARVWDWKHEYGSAITDQMRRLGASVDWSREYFTMDDRLSVAVKEAFVRLWEQGLIYRGAYIVNWDPVQGTAVSDLEVTHEERAGKLYHIRYPFADGPLPDGTDSIVIATTRPETMLGDVAVAVNPEDPRYQHAIGKRLTLPLSGVDGGPPRTIPVVCDTWANPEFGTGAVKVTPAHDPNDFAIGKRHHLPSPVIMDESARISLAGSPYFGLDRFAARERIVADLEAAGLLVAIQEHMHAIALSQRSGAVIEPRLSMQWFLAVNKPVPDGKGGERASIAQTAIDAVREGHIRFTPEMYAKTYFEWMGNIHDWCISRQLWWGHRIPAWHCNACGKISVAREPIEACSGCGITDIRQETDVLDTWFSSALLPFTVFGWPGEMQGTGSREQGVENGHRESRSLLPIPYSLTPDLQAFYPTSLLVTGFDILFFWVARMIMLGCHFMLDVPLEARPRTLAEAVPFKEVYIHALVRDANREKMSKTKGNVVDPIEIVTKYGTDAVRFTLASQASPGTDIAFSEARTEGYRAFANKIWNAARFLFMNLDRARDAGVAFSLTLNVQDTQVTRDAQDAPAHSDLPAAEPDALASRHSAAAPLAHMLAVSTPLGDAVLLTDDPGAGDGSATLHQPHAEASHAAAHGSVHAHRSAGAAQHSSIPPSAVEPIDSTLDPVAVDHSITGKLASFLAATTPRGEAVLQTGLPEIVNPVIAPGGHHQPVTGTERSVGATPGFAGGSEMQPLEARWILTRLSQTAGAVNASLAEYRFDEAASHIYQFFWGDLCDWYLEIVKLRLHFDDPARKAETSAALTTLVEVFEAALRLLSPFMPFLTEEIWHALYAGNPPAKSIALTRFPQAADYPADAASVSAIELLQELITNVRALRKEVGVPEKEAAPIVVHAPANTAETIRENSDFLARLARVSGVAFTDAALAGAGSRSTPAFDVQVVYERQIDVAAERERLTKELAKLNKTLAANEGRLADSTFLGKAPAHIIEGLRKQTDETRTLRDKAQASLEALPRA